MTQTPRAFLLIAIPLVFQIGLLALIAQMLKSADQAALIESHRAGVLVANKHLGDVMQQCYAATDALAKAPSQLISGRIDELQSFLIISTRQPLHGLQSPAANLSLSAASSICASSSAPKPMMNSPFGATPA